MATRSPLHQALAAWRFAEHRLESLPADDPERPRLEREIEQLRVAYQALFDEVEDVAGHGAPYVDEDGPPAT